MMDDHILLSQVRNDLADALKALLKPGIMDGVDFLESLRSITASLEGIGKLLRQDCGMYVILDTDGEFWGPFLSYTAACEWAHGNWPGENPEPRE